MTGPVIWAGQSSLDPCVYGLCKNRITRMSLLLLVLAGAGSALAQSATCAQFSPGGQASSLTNPRLALLSSATRHSSPLSCPNLTGADPLVARLCLTSGHL